MTSITSTKYLTLASGETVFYRTAGELNSSTILLLHGFPSSSHQYRNLIPLLAQKYRVIAPDLPGFGFTTTPASYKHTFDALSNTIAAFLEAIPNPPQKYALYIFDYGAPVGLRLALKKPEAITAIVSQNGNAYVEGLTSGWDPIRKYWVSGSAADRDALHAMLAFETTKMQYEHGTTDPSTIAPESYTLDQALLDRPGNDDVQLDLFYDYQNNLKLYPAFQSYFHTSQVPLLAVWGRHDPFFGPAGVEAYKRDLPKAEVHLLDAGHFVVETHTKVVADYMLKFFEGNGI